MISEQRVGLAQVLQPFRPVPPGKPNILKALLASQSALEDLMLLSDRGGTMKTACLCALGGRAHYPVETAIEHFGEEFRQRLRI